MNVIGLGVDIVDVERIERLLQDDGFARRVFSAEEIELCDGTARPAECYAARWAAREACAKALGGIPEARWRDIRVVRDEDGAVSIELDGVARARAAEVGAERILVSFSHERSQAVACCLALGA
ncbi:MAG: holo-ACP synthase [Actinomycetota bacterium]